MKTVSFRIGETDSDLLYKYVKINNLNLSEFIRTTILDKIEEELQEDEEKILKTLKKAKKGKIYNHEEIWSD